MTTRARPSVPRAAVYAGIMAARARVLESYHPDSCIVTVRVALEVLDHFGVPARPVVVQAVVANAPWWEASQAGHPDPLDVPGAWSVGLGVPAPGKAWALHLVVVTDDALVDPSLDQASRPGRGIVVGPAVFPLGPDARRELLAGRPLTFGNDDGVVITYQARVGNREYTASPNWGRRDAHRRAAIAAYAIRVCERYVTG